MIHLRSQLKTKPFKQKNLMNSIFNAKLFSTRFCAYAFLFITALIFLSNGPASAQCKVSSLDVSTGVYNSAAISPTNTDPLWFIANKTGNYTGTTPSVGSNAMVVNPNGGWTPTPGGIWICDKQAHANGIILSTPSSITFERRFTLCSASDIDFNLSMRSDGQITDILVDGVSQGLSQTTLNFASGPMWNQSFSQYLAAGSHTLGIIVSNPNVTQWADGLGLIVAGTVSSATANIVNNQNPDCSDYSCCDDQCYWTLEGNNVSSGRNILGTLSNNDIRIVTNGSVVGDRGVIKGGNASTGGFFGWNTTAPAARFHVNCINGNNPTRVVGMPSDIRFENLEPGTGKVLVIDDQGYVYNSGVALAELQQMGAMKQEIRELKLQLAELRSTLANSTSVGELSSTSNVLYQNSPNPFNGETAIKYSINEMQTSAMIVIYDLNGRELQKYPVQKGTGTVTVSIGTLVPGMYLYSLVVDGREVDTKRMVLDK
jgi:hypothetical protein